MVKELLNALNIKNREARFLSPPQSGTYAVWFDSFESRGADDLNLLRDHDYMIELYEFTPDPKTEQEIEAALDRLGIGYTKQNRFFLESEQLYQVIYEFSKLEKGGQYYV